MRKSSGYFPVEDGPQPIVRSVKRAVRFEETDPIGVVWHGRYASYFEDARVMLTDSIGIGYFACYAATLLIPVTHMRLEFKIPMRYGDLVVISAALHYTQAARLHISYAIRNNGLLVCAGCTIQHFTDLNGNLCPARPAIYDNLCARWAAGKIPLDMQPYAMLAPAQATPA